MQKYQKPEIEIAFFTGAEIMQGSDVDLDFGEEE